MRINDNKVLEVKIMSQQISSIINEYSDTIYGFFLGDKKGNLLKEEVFTSEYCTPMVLKNIAKALCSFATETNISDYGTIKLSKSKISFSRFGDIVYVLNHNIEKKETIRALLSDLATVFEERSRAKFFARSDKELFSGASAIFRKIVPDLFAPVLEYIKRAKEEKEKQKKLEEDRKKKTKESKKTEETRKIALDENQEKAIKKLLISLKTSFKDIEHVVLMKKKEEKVELFYAEGELTKGLVNETVRVINKYRSEVIDLLKDEDIAKNIIELTADYQLVFTDVDGQHFLYIIAKKTLDLVIMSSIFIRIANRISDELKKN